MFAPGSRLLGSYYTHFLYLKGVRGETSGCQKAMVTPKGGFDCEFVAAPPRSLECPVCLLTLREPHVISCCGNQFCRPCIQRIQNDSKPCPLCNEPNFTTFLHKGVMREVNSLMVRCPQKELGCDWEGELGQLQQHLNPAMESRGKGCGFVLIDCVYKCGEQFPRREIHQHELEECLRRPIEVQISSLARKLESTRAENQFLKKDLSEKLNAVMVENKVIKAENQAIKAETQAIKAETQAIKAENQTMKAENQAIKTETQAIRAENQAIKAENQTIKAENQAIKAENKALQETVKQLQSNCALLKSCVNPTPPFYFTLNNVQHYMQEDLIWMSPPFYSHAGGYKMCIVVFANGYGIRKGTHLSLFVGIMRGEYDDQLQWPFRGKVTIQQALMHRDKWGNDTTITFDRAVPYKYRKKPLGCVGNAPWGFLEVIKHDQLRFHCDEDDKIRFRVNSVDL